MKSLLTYPVNHLRSRSTLFFFLLWIGFWSLPYWLLGSFSHLRFYDEADLTLSRILYDIHRHTSGIFLHAVQGGGDYYGSFETGSSYFNLERFLFKIFPIWPAYLLHKILVITVSLSGAWLLLKRVSGVDSFQAFCLGTIITVYNPYSVHTTLTHGIGYAVLPLAIFCFVACSGERKYFLYTTLLSFLIAISSTSTKSFLVICVGTILSALFLKVDNPAKFLAALLLLVILTAANNLETLYGQIIYGGSSARAIEGGHPLVWRDIILGGWDYLIAKTDFLFLGQRLHPVLYLSSAVFILAFYLKERSAWRMMLFTLITFHITTVIYSIPWDRINLSFINSINFQRIAYVFIIPVSLLAANLVKNYPRSKYTIYLPTIFLCVSILILTCYQKMLFQNLVIHMQSVSRMEGIPNLKERRWEPNELYRAVSAGPYLGLHPNILWSYGIETLDGHTNLVPQDVVQFWRYGIHKNQINDKRTPMIGGNVYITYWGERNPFGESINEDVAKRGVVDLNPGVDLNLLRMVNVSHILSYIPLQGNGLQKVSGSDTAGHLDLWWSGTPTLEKLKKALYYLFHIPEVFVYQFDDYSQRAFFPSRIERLDPELSLPDQFRWMSSQYEKNISFTEGGSLVPAAGLIKSIDEVANGYRVVVLVNQPGVFVLNTFPFEFWKVYIDDRPADSFPMSKLHLGVHVEVGEHAITYQYERPLLFK